MDVIDITRLQKVNKLADTLNRHGLASNKIEAAELASDMAGRAPEQLRGIEIDNQQRMFVRANKPIMHSEEGEHTLIPEQIEKPEVKETPKVEGISKEYMENILQKFADQFCEEINKLNNKVTQLEKRANNITQQSSVQSQNMQEVRSEQPQQQLAQEAPKQPQNEHPRSKGVNPDDVAIENFFYYGQK